jgi:hypothetical protein
MNRVNISLANHETIGIDLFCKHASGWFTYAKEGRITMKKMKMLGLASFVRLGFTGFAQAAEIKATGAFQIDSYWNNSMNFTTLDKTRASTSSSGSAPPSVHRQRELKGVLETQIGSNPGQWPVPDQRRPHPHSTATAPTAPATATSCCARVHRLQVARHQVNSVGFQTVKLLPPSAAQRHSGRPRWARPW